jgi:hypothetical protein
MPEDEHPCPSIFLDLSKILLYDLGRYFQSENIKRRTKRQSSLAEAAERAEKAI